MAKSGGRLSDTEALSRQGKLAPAGNCYAGEIGWMEPKGHTLARDSADYSVAKPPEPQWAIPGPAEAAPSPRRTGVGSESLAQACKIAKGE